MTKIYKDIDGKVILLSGNRTIEVPVQRNEFGNTGTVDSAGLAELGWNQNDIDWLQSVCWWDEADNEFWRVTDANKAFGPTGTTPITWSNYTTYKSNVDLRYFPKLSTPSSYIDLFNGFEYIYAVPTDGWSMKLNRTASTFFGCYSLVSVGDFAKLIEGCNFTNTDYNMFFASAIRTIGKITQPFTMAGYMRGTFSTCWNLRKLEGLHLNTSAVTLSYAFSDCSSLETLDLPVISSSGFSQNKLYSLANIPHSGKISGNLSLTDSMLTRVSCLVLFNALDAEATGKTISLNAISKARLSDADKQIVTDKGWTLA